MLFLAEKQAALEVVKRRLDRARLGDFCLEIHSDKVSPKTVVASLKNRYELGVGLNVPAVQRIDPTWRQSREEISSNVNALHASELDGETPYSLVWASLRGRSLNADLAGAFEDVEIPVDLLQNPAPLPEINGQVQIFADMARMFVDNFGHPSRSPWSQISFFDFPACDARRFLQAVSAIKAPVRAMEEAISRHAGLGIAGADDFDTLADFDRNVGDVPELGLAAIAGLDLEDLECALAIQAELLRIEGDLAAMPHLRYEDPERLAIAIALMHSEVGAELSERAPVSAYRSAANEAAVLLQLTNAVKSMLPALDLLGLGHDIPASQLQTVASVISTVCAPSVNSRRWIVELPRASKVDVDNATDRWLSLAAADAAWITRLRRFPPGTRLSLEDVEAAATTLRKVGIGRAFAALTGSMRAAHELCEWIGIDASPTDLEALAAHLRAIRAFEEDHDLALLLGPAWDGVRTPFKDVREGIRLRDLLNQTLRSLGGESAIPISAEVLASLPPAVAACKSLLGLPHEAKIRLDNTLLHRLLSGVRRRIASLQAFLAVDPCHLLAGLEAPICRIANAHTLLKRAERVRTTLANRPTSIQASTLGSSNERLAQTSRAIGLDTVHSCLGHKREREIFASFEQRSRDPSVDRPSRRGVGGDRSGY